MNKEELIKKHKIYKIIIIISAIYIPIGFSLMNTLKNSPIISNNISLIILIAIINLIIFPRLKRKIKERIEQIENIEIATKKDS